MRTEVLTRLRRTSIVRPPAPAGRRRCRGCRPGAAASTRRPAPALARRSRTRSCSARAGRRRARAATSLDRGPQAVEPGEDALERLGAPARAATLPAGRGRAGGRPRRSASQVGASGEPVKARTRTSSASAVRSPGASASAGRSGGGRASAVVRVRDAAGADDAGAPGDRRPSSGSRAVSIRCVARPSTSGWVRADEHVLPRAAARSGRGMPVGLDRRDVADGAGTSRDVDVDGAVGSFGRGRPVARERVDARTRRTSIARADGGAGRIAGPRRPRRAG